MDTFTAVPSSVRKFTTFTLAPSVPDYLPADGWALHLLIQSGTQPTLDKTADVVGTGWKFTYTELDTGSLGVGFGRWVMQVVRGSGPSLERYDVGTGTIDVLQSFSAAAEGELQPIEEKLLNLVNLRLEGRFTSDMDSYQIGSRAISKIPIKELWKIRNQLQAAVNALRRGSRPKPSKRVAFTGVHNER